MHRETHLTLLAQVQPPPPPCPPNLATYKCEPYRQANLAHRGVILPHFEVYKLFRSDSDDKPIKFTFFLSFTFLAATLDVERPALHLKWLCDILECYGFSDPVCVGVNTSSVKHVSPLINKISLYSTILQFFPRVMFLIYTSCLCLFTYL